MLSNLILHISSLYMILMGLKSCSMYGQKILGQLSGSQVLLTFLWVLALLIVLALVSKVDEKEIDATFIGRIQLAFVGMGILLYLCYLIFCR